MTSTRISRKKPPGLPDTGKFGSESNSKIEEPSYLFAADLYNSSEDEYHQGRVPLWDLTDTRCYLGQADPNYTSLALEAISFNIISDIGPP